MSTRRHYGRRRADRSPMERRADELAETMAEASGLPWMSSQLPGLALMLVSFAENEIRISRLPQSPEAGASALVESHSVAGRVGNRERVECAPPVRQEGQSAATDYAKAVEADKEDGDGLYPSQT